MAADTKWKISSTPQISNLTTDIKESDMSKHLVERVFECLNHNVSTEKSILNFLHIVGNKEETQVKECLDNLRRNGKIKMKEIKCSDKVTFLYWIPALSKGKTVNPLSSLSTHIIPSPDCQKSPESTVLGRSLHSSFRSPLLKRSSSDSCNQHNENTPCKRLKTETNSMPAVENQEFIGNSPLSNTSNSYQAAGSDDTDKLVKERYSLIKEVENKKELLRKLNLVKMYRTKNNMDTMQKLIDKWRVVSQQAAQRLLENSSGSKPISMGELLNFFQIDHRLLKYSDEDEMFY